MRTKTTFLLAGLIGGLICVLPGPLLSIFTLTWGVGPAFFFAVLAAIVVTGARHHLQAGFLHYIAGLIVCILAYFLGLTVFAAVLGFSPDWFGLTPSDNFDQFGMDIVLGLVAAAIFAAAGIALFAFVLTGRWSNFLLVRLLLAGILTIVVTFLINLPFRSYWSFYGVLLPLGNALFCYLVGGHILRGKVETQAVTTAAQPYQRSA